MGRLAQLSAKLSWGWAGPWHSLACLARLGGTLARQERTKHGPSKTAKRSGTAAPNRPKTHQKRSRLAAENGTSESGKKSLGKAFAKARTKAWAGLR